MTKAYSTSHCEDAASLEKLSCDFEEVKDLLQKGKAFFVDVREPKELVNDGRIPGCVNIPLNDVGTALELPPEKFKEKYGRDKPSPDDPNVIFSCRKGVRATSAMQTAHARGYHAARFYRGSFCDWEERGGEVIKGWILPPAAKFVVGLLSNTASLRNYIAFFFRLSSATVFFTCPVDLEE